MFLYLLIICMRLYVCNSRISMFIFHMLYYVHIISMFISVSMGLCMFLNVCLLY